MKILGSDSGNEPLQRAFIKLRINVRSFPLVKAVGECFPLFREIPSLVTNLQVGQARKEFASKSDVNCCRAILCNKVMS